MKTEFENGHLTWIGSYSADVIRMRTRKATLNGLVGVGNVPLPNWGAGTTPPSNSHILSTMELGWLRRL